MESQKRVAKPYRTWQRCGRLASVFSVERNKDLHVLMACLCVLFEDLRIEVSGLAENELGRLDDGGKNGREMYFLRRSIATLYEFAGVLQELEELPAFQPVRARFDELALRYWTRALIYFRKHESYVARMRHNVGGHFGKQAAELAVKNLLPDAVGSLEVAFYAKGGGAKLFFAKEIAATAILRHVPGDSSQARARNMFRHALVAYRHAVRAVDCITHAYLWDRFGK